MFTFLTTLIVYSIKKVLETCWYSHSVTCKVKRTNWVLKIFTFNDKNPLYRPLTLTLQFFFVAQSDQGGIQLVIKPFGIFQTSRIVSLS